jgi:putative membrane protein
MADHRQPDPVDPRIYFAAERTLLAWIRTGLSMMGFGFVVARFGMFLRELPAAADAPHHLANVHSPWVGTTLVLLGIAANLIGAVNHARTLRRLNRGETLRFEAFSAAIVISLLLAAIGTALAVYFIFGLAQPSH